MNHESLERMVVGFKVEIIAGRRREEGMVMGSGNVLVFLARNDEDASDDTSER